MNFPQSFTLAAILTIAGCQSTKKTEESQLKSVEQLNTPKAGHYTGYMRIADAVSKTPVSFELIPLNNKEAPAVYRGHIKFSNGSHSGHEYVSYNFENSSFNTTNNSIGFLTLNGLTSMTLTYRSAAKSSGRIRISTGQEAELVLIHESDSTSGDVAAEVYPELPIAKTITGEYKGSCGNESAVMEIEAVKTRGHSPDDAGELTGYLISGRFGQSDKDSCKGSGPCFRRFFPQGTFNMLSGKLTLKEEKSELQCTLLGDTLDCGACKYQQQPNSVYAILSKEDQEKTKPVSIIKGKSPKFETNRGQFYGYVHNARQNTYQLIAINIFDESGDSGKSTAAADTSQVTGVATLYFGNGDSNEYIAYKMKPAAVSKNDQRFFWDSDGEIVLKIITWKSDVMVGDWISKSFGRVGNFMVQKGQMPQMTAAVSLLPKVSGIYASDEWEFEIAAYSELSENSQEIYPLNSYGWAKEKNPSARRRIIKKVSYDFYSGTIAFNLDDGRTIVGRTGQDNMLMMWWPRVHYGAPFSPIKPMKFEKISDNPTPQANLEIPRTRANDLTE